MFQTFNTDTLISRFIKQLLATTKIPTLTCVHDGDKLIKDCNYIYKHVVIRCTKSGTVEPCNFISADLVPGRVTIQTPEHNDHAEAEILCYVDDVRNMEPYTYYYRSPVRWYDSETHKHLGNYLRYLQHSQHLNLMPFYNCYSGLELSDTQITGAGVVQNVSTSQRVIAVPIKFNRQYTIAIDAPTGVDLSCAIIPSLNLLLPPRGMRTDSFSHYSCLEFNTPICFSYTTDEASCYQYERDLYLLMQLDTNNTSSIVVLEGNYTNLNCLHTDESTTINRSLCDCLSLLEINSKQSYAFSDRLVEYLLNNVVTSADSSNVNIEHVQRALCKLDSQYANYLSAHHGSEGVWDSNIPQAVLRVLERYKDDFYLTDQDGNINKQVEDLFVRLGVYNR